MNHKEFESNEQNRFLDTWYNLENTKLLVPSLTIEQYPSVRLCTKKGLEQGVEKFLKDYSDVDSIYRLKLDDLRKFYFDKPAEAEILAELKKKHEALENIDVFAEDVSGAYSNFVYQDSVYKFEEKFKIPIKIQ